MLKISILTLLCVFTLSAQAQIPTAIDGVTIISTAPSPRPGQNVTIYLESYNYDLNSASIIWTVDGKIHSQGIGIKEITYIAPNVGLRSNISAAIKFSDGREVVKTMTLKSGTVDLIWEAQGYTPPFFKGKLPFAYQNPIRVIAMPHLSADGRTELDPKTLVYVWKLGGKYIENGQGQGKQSIDLPVDNLPRTLEVSVDVSNREGTERASATIILKPTEPSLSFYEENSLYGVLYNKALTNRVPLRTTEIKVLAVPYGFNRGNENSYAWSINNIEQADLFSNRSIVLRTSGKEEGSSNINLDIRNQEDILQGARGGFTVYFTKREIEDFNTDPIF